MSNYEKHFFSQLRQEKHRTENNKDRKIKETGGKKVTYCFLRHVIGLTLLALKLCMMDPSPSTHCWKTQNHWNTKLTKLKRGKNRKVWLGGRLLLEAMRNVNNLCWGINCPCHSPYHGKAQPHFINFTHHYSSSTNQRDCAFHSSKCYM